MRMSGVAVAMVVCCGVAQGQPLPEDTTEIRELSVEQARLLVNRHRDSTLDLPGLESLPIEVASVLATHDGRLNLDGVASMPDEVLAMLAAHENDLSLGGLPSLTDAQAEIWAKRTGGTMNCSAEVLTERQKDILEKNERITFMFRK